METSLMQRTMKSSTIKTIVVCLTADNILKFEIDSADWEDPFVEAATRAVESNKENRGAIIRAITQCWDEKTPKKVEMINSYWILLNASCFRKAEQLREKFKMQHKIDLAKEPLHARRTGKSQ
jgi:hypothetical protein